MKSIRNTLLVVGAVLIGATALFGQAPGFATRYRQANEARILADFAALLALPNVATDSANIRRNADFIAARLRDAGVRSTVWHRDKSAPIVFGTLHVPGARRTLGVYVHYDGQPVTASEWSNAAWSPTLYSRAIEAGGERIPMPRPGQHVDPEARIYARSAGDDKAPIAALLAVLESMNLAGVRPTANLVFLFDGEEEAGSPNLRAYLEEHARELAGIDAWLFLDGPVHQSGAPMLAFGVRGVTGLQITVYGAVRPLHSGHYGNWAPNPALMLSQLLAAMKNERGDVVIPGFYASTAPVGAEERRALAALPDFDKALMRELGIARTEGDSSLAARVMLPSLNIRGITSAATGESTANVIPATATAALDIRLGKGNDPQDMLNLVERFIAQSGYHIVRTDPDTETRLKYPKIAKVTREEGYAAARTPMGLPIVQDLIKAAGRASADKLVLLPSLGGSLPLYLFSDVLKQPFVIAPIANYDDNQHAADENLRIGNLWYAIDLYASLLTASWGQN